MKGVARWRTCLLCFCALPLLASVEQDDRSDALALVHEFKRLVDVFEFERVRDERVNLDLARHHGVHHLGQLGAALDAAEGTALPH